jgi:hypothetical protein
MSWAKFDDEYPRHQKIQSIPAAVRADAIALELAALCYSTRLLSDGRISTAVTQSLALEVGFEHRNRVDLRRLRRTISALIEAGRWHENGGSGYTIHDFPDYQPTSGEVKERRRKETEKKRKQRAQGRLSLDLSPTSSPGDTEEPSRRDSPGDASRVGATGAGAPTRPVPYPGESASSALSPQGEGDLASPPAAQQAAPAESTSGELPQEVAFREANTFVVGGGYAQPNDRIEHRLRADWPELIEEDIGSLLATADEMREREIT